MTTFTHTERFFVGIVGPITFTWGAHQCLYAWAQDISPMPTAALAYGVFFAAMGIACAALALVDCTRK